MALTDKERANIEKQVNDLETTITEQEITSSGIEKTLAKLKEAEAFNKSQWNKFQLNIQNYEKEMEGLIAEYIVDPISENDVVSLAGSGGRLYHNPEGTDAKKISQFKGTPVAFVNTRELSNKQQILDAMNLLRQGTGNSGASQPLAFSYTAGDSTISFQFAISTGWILVGGNTLLKITSGTSGGVCTGESPSGSGVNQTTCLANGGTWEAYNTYNIIDRINDQSYNFGDSATPTWGGFTNTERVNKSPTNASQQQLMNDLIVKLQTELGVWQSHMQNKVIIFADKNGADNMDVADLAQHHSDNNFLITYLATTEIFDIALDEVTARINDREAFRVARAERCRVAKAEYYGQRLNFTNLRGDVQSGTLKRITFLSGIKVSGGFQPGGTKEQQSALKSLNKLLEEG